MTPRTAAPLVITLRGCTIVGLIVAGACTVRPAAQLEAAAAIEAAYRRADAAYVSAKTLGDLEAIRSWLDTPDCVYADFGQSPRPWTEMRRYAAEALRTPIVRFESTIRRLDVHGDAATATTLVKGVAHIVDADGQFGAKGASHDIETEATVRDAWVMRGGSWRRRSHLKIVANRLTAVDGKPPHTF